MCVYYTMGERDVMGLIDRYETLTNVNDQMSGINLQLSNNNIYEESG